MSAHGGGGATISYALQSTKWYYKKAASEMGLHQREPLFLGLWATWVVTGSLFYAYAPDFELGLIKGFYMAINIGYSIGFGYPMDQNTNSIWFSTFYVLIGASFVGVALGFFAEKITQDSETWFSRLQDKKKIEDFILMGNQNWKGRIQAWMYGQRSALKAVFLWLAFVVTLIIISYYAVGWTLREAQYFAISTLSTGGHWMIPEDSPEWLYAVTGALTMLGVPVMALAMAAIGQAMMDQGSLEEAKSAINDPVTKEELQLLEDLGLEDGDGRIDLSEFILLCMVRVGTDPGLLTYIRQRFKDLSVENGEFLTIEEVTQDACIYIDGSVRRRDSVPANMPERPPSGLPLHEEEDEDDNSSVGSVSDSKTHPDTPELNNGDLNTSKNSNHSSKLASDSTSPPTETELSDMEEGQQQPQPNDIPHSSAGTHTTNNLNSHQLTQSTVLQPVLDTTKENVRALKRGDDMGMALLDRSYVLSPSEEKHILQEARNRMKILVERSLDQAAWSPQGKIAGVKISSREGINGSPLNMVKGVVDLGDDFSYDMVTSQVKYILRNGDSWCQFYKRLDPTCIQTTLVSRIASASLLDEDAREACVVAWAAIRPPVRVVAERDICAVLHMRRMECPVTGEPIVFTNFFSVVHPAVPEMERAVGRVRAEIKMAGYIVRPSRTNKDHYQLTYLLQYDPKGALPVAVVNAFTVSQGLNAGRFRDLFGKDLQIARDLNNGTTPMGCYDMKRLGRAVHELQLFAGGHRFAGPFAGTRTFRFTLSIRAEHPATLRLATKADDGMPLPYALSRAEPSDSVAKKLAAGKPVAFGGKGHHLFTTSLLLTVEGPIPDALTLRFHNVYWRHNKLYVPAIARLTSAPTPDPSSGSGSSSVR